MLRQQEIKDFKIHSVHIHIHASEMSASMALFLKNLHWQDLIEASGVTVFLEKAKEGEKGETKVNQEDVCICSE